MTHSLEQLEELLIEADLGAKTAAELVAALAKRKFDKDISPRGSAAIPGR